jgi:Na+/H+ antiporter
MQGLEQLLAIFIAAIVLSAAARRVGAPYPVFLALGGAGIALLPLSPVFTLPPELALALFVAPVLLDSAYDMSLRDLRDNWIPIAGLVVCAVGLTTLGVALVTHALIPEMPWAAAVALGAIVAPPDAVAAGAVLRPLRPPHRILTVLEGESLLNDASALLIYRIAVGSVAAGGFTAHAIGPIFLLGVIGSLVAGVLLGRMTLEVMVRIEHVPTAIILQFVFTFGVWILADETGLSAVLTMVSYAATLKRMGLRRTPARLRVPTNAVWSTAVFALNIFAFVFIGLQLRPIIEASTEDELVRYLMVAGAVIPTVIAVRCGWVMSFNGLIRWKQERYGFHPPRPMLRPSIGGGLVVSWSGMRGIVTLAAAMALPKDFPHRDMIVLVAFGVTLGTLVIQGLTLKPLLRVLHLRDDDPVGRETDAGREHAFRAGIAAIDESQSPMAAVVRARFLSLLASLDGPDTAHGAAAAVQGTIYRQALDAARQALLAMRKANEIGDDAYQRVEQELDSMEIALSEVDRSR